MANLITSYTAEVLRGWPNDGARDNYETPKAGETHRNGDLVFPAAGGVVTNLGVTGTGLGVGAGNGVIAGLVISGAGDSASAAASGKEVVIWGNAIVRVSAYTSVSGAPVPDANGNVATAALVAAGPGARVTARAASNGTRLQYDLAVVGATTALVDPVIGFVKEVSAGVAGVNTATVTIVLF